MNELLCKKRSQQEKKIIIGFSLLVIIFAIVIVFLWKRNDISKKEYKYYITYDNQFLDIEKKYLNTDGYIETQDIPQLLDEIEDIAQNGIKEGIIKEYTKDKNNIYIEFSSGINYIFIPYQENKLNNGTGGKIATIDPADDTFGVRKERLMMLIDKYYNKLAYTGSYLPVGNANMIKNAFNDMYKYNLLSFDPLKLTPEYAFSNDKVTVDAMKKWGDYKIIIFEGHGAYNTKLHSCLVTGETFLGFEEFSKYKEDIKNKNIVLTSFPQIPGTNVSYSPVRQYCITSRFIDTYLTPMDESLVFLGACSSGKDDVLAQALIDKGAAIVLGYTEDTSMEYEMMTRTMFFYGLTQVDDKDKYMTISQALDYAKNNIGSDDPWGGNNSELVCFTKDNLEKKYTLNGIEQGEDDELEEKESFATAYYDERLKELGIADEYIETKLVTTENQGASTVCLAPSESKLGIIYRSISDFDKNGIDDLLVIALREYDGKVILDKSVYYFDKDGNCTPSGSSNDNPIQGKCNYYFYMAGDYLVCIEEDDISGDWIDNLRYEVIPEKTQIHHDKVHVVSYDPGASDNGEGKGEIIYINKDFRYSDSSVCYTIDDLDAYYAIYNRNFMLSSAENRCVASEKEGCDIINTLLSDILDGNIGKMKPVSWDERWNDSFFPTDAPPESYAILKVDASPSYKTGETTTESEIVIRTEYVSGDSNSKNE